MLAPLVLHYPKDPIIFYSKRARLWSCYVVGKIKLAAIII